MSSLLRPNVCIFLSFTILNTLFLSLANSQIPEANRLILHNAIVWTVDEDNPTAEAVAIKDGNIIAVGSNAEVLKLKKANKPTTASTTPMTPKTIHNVEGPGNA